MIKFLKNLWNRITTFLFPKEYFAWQTVVYLGLFSFAMSWVARLSGAFGITESLIATAGWVFFALGIRWFLEKNNARLLGISVAPWVAGAIVCAYFFGLIPGGNWSIALMSWPLISVSIVAIPEFLSWELKPKLPQVAVRQQLILFLLTALLFSSWFQFYFRLQSWFEDYPSLATDNFSNSGFVHRLAGQSAEQATGVSLLTAAEMEVKSSLDGTPWPYVERWLLNLNDQVVKLQLETADTLETSMEKDMWELAARPRSLNDGYALDLLAIWSGPASDPDGYYYEKTCVLQQQPQPQPTNTADNSSSTPTMIAEVDCELATPRRIGKPDSIAR